jgi:hypothetical protein
MFQSNILLPSPELEITYGQFYMHGAMECYTELWEGQNPVWANKNNSVKISENALLQEWSADKEGTMKWDYDNLHFHIPGKIS